MTREEKQKAIDALKTSAPVMAVTQEEFNDYIKTLNKIMDWLEQEPCEDEYIKVPKKALKYRTAGMVAYNVEWLKNHFDIERTIICGAQQLCEDAISRKALISHIENQSREWGEDYDAQQILGDIEDMQPVNPQDCDTCEVGNPCLYCKHEFEPKVPDTNIGNMAEIPTGSESEEV